MLQEMVLLKPRKIRSPGTRSNLQRMHGLLFTFASAVDSGSPEAVSSGI